MADNKNNQSKQECKCQGNKDLKAIQQQVLEMKDEIQNLHKEIERLRKAVRK